MVESPRDTSVPKLSRHRRSVRADVADDGMVLSDCELVTGSLTSRCGRLVSLVPWQGRVVFDVAIHSEAAGQVRANLFRRRVLPVRRRWVERPGAGRRAHQVGTFHGYSGFGNPEDHDPPIQPGETRSSGSGSGMRRSRPAMRSTSRASGSARVGLRPRVRRAWGRPRQRRASARTGSVEQRCSPAWRVASSRRGLPRIGWRRAAAASGVGAPGLSRRTSPVKGVCPRGQGTLLGCDEPPWRRLPRESTRPQQCRGRPDQAGEPDGQRFDLGVPRLVPARGFARTVPT